MAAEENKRLTKRGISPLVATVLLIAVAAIALTLIFVWFRTFEAERIEKLGAPVENVCQRIIYSAEISGNRVLINNQGSIPIYAINLEIVKEGEAITRFLRPRDGFIDADEEDFVTMTVADLSGKIDSVAVIPLILGKGTTTGEDKLHTCVSQGQYLR